MTLNDLERRDTRGQNFLADLHNYARRVWLRITEFGEVTQADEKHISMDKTRPIYKGCRAPASQGVFLDLLHAHTQYEKKSNQIVHDDLTKLRYFILLRKKTALLFSQ